MKKYKASKFILSSFFTIPYALFDNPYYSNVSNEAKLLYGLVIDRISLSIKNKEDWVDENNEVYCYYTNEAMQKILNRSKPFVIKLKKELLDMLIPIRQAGKVVLTINYGKGEKTKKNLESESKKFDFVAELLPAFEAKEIYQPMEEFNQNNIYSLKDAKNFLCLLNPEKFRTLEQYKSSLENVDFDILLIEPSINGEFFSREQIESLKKKSSGARRLVIAYLSIGEAEDYRYYWKRSWNKKYPDWIAEENGNWSGNYRVKYWSPEWKSIIKDYQKKLDEIGVDGYLLDTVDTYQYFEENYKKILE